MRIERVRHLGAEVIVTGCPAHLPVLVETARQALITRAASHTMPDGRTVGAVAAEVVDGLLDPEDGAA